MKKLFLLLPILLLIGLITQAATILYPVGGGTGTSTAPTYGQVLVGNSGGTYDVVATSTLGVGGANFTGSGSKDALTYWTSATNLSATSSPTVGFITATTTTLNWFGGDIEIANAVPVLTFTDTSAGSDAFTLTVNADTFTLQNTTDGTGLISSDNTNLVTIGSGPVPSVSITTDGTGDGELSVPGDSIALGAETNGNYTASVAEGTATDISGAVGEGQAAIVNFDSTEVSNTTWGSGGGFTWTFNAGATDPTFSFANGAFSLTPSLGVDNLLIDGNTLSSVTGNITLTSNNNTIQMSPASTTQMQIFNKLQIGSTATTTILGDNATSTFSGGSNLLAGCYALQGICLSQDSITVNNSAATDLNFLDGDIDWTINTASNPDDLTATVGCTDCVALSTETSGNYVATVADGTGIDGTASGEGTTYTPTFDATELTNLTWSAAGGSKVVWTFDLSTSPDTKVTFDSASTTFNGGVSAGDLISAPYIVATSTTATSTYTFDLRANAIDSTNLNATSTFRGGLTALNNFRVAPLINCNTIDTDSVGNFLCGVDGGGGGGDSKWATTTASINGIYPSGGANTDVLIGATATTTTAKLEVIGDQVIDGNANETQLRVQGNSTQTQDMVVIEKFDGSNLWDWDTSSTTASGVDSMFLALDGGGKFQITNGNATSTTDGVLNLLVDSSTANTKAALLVDYDASSTSGTTDAVNIDINPSGNLSGTQDRLNRALTANFSMGGTHTSSGTTTGKLYSGTATCNPASATGGVTCYGLDIDVTGGSAGQSTNYGVYVDVVSADDNYAFIAERGNSGFGSTTPWRTLDVNGTVALQGLTLNTGASTNSLCLSNKFEVTRNTDNETCITSSAKYKKNILPLTVGIDELMQLRPVAFEYKDAEGERYGLIAEEVAKVDPQFVSYLDGQPESVRWSHITTLLVKSVQEQQIKIEELEARLKRLENK